MRSASAWAEGRGRKRDREGNLVHSVTMHQRWPDPTKTSQTHSSNNMRTQKPGG